MKKLLKFLLLGMIIPSVIILHIMCIGLGIIMADKYKNQEYPFKNAEEDTEISRLSTTKSINNLPEQINPNYIPNGTFSINTTGKTTWTNPDGDIMNNWRCYSDTTYTVTALNMYGGLKITTTGSGEGNPSGYYINLYNDTVSIPKGTYTISVVISDPWKISQLNVNGATNSFDFTRDGNLIYRTFTITSDLKDEFTLVQLRWFGAETITIYGVKLESGSACTAPLGMDDYQGIYDNGYNEGKENGYDDALQLARANVFSSSTKINAYVDEDNHILTSPIEILPNGISFSKIAAEADKHIFDNGINEQSFTVVFQFEPFLYEENQIYISKSYGFAALIFYDAAGNKYNMTWGGQQTDNGYVVSQSSGNTIVGEKIVKAEITFANVDYVGDLITPDYLSYEDFYNNGYNDGYKNGYNIGVGQTIGSLTGWDAVKNGITSIFEALQIKVFGLFSLGDVIMICLVFAVVMFFLKVIRG